MLLAMSAAPRPPPRTSEPPQVAAWPHEGVEPRVGFEPTTPALRKRCAAAATRGGVDAYAIRAFPGCGNGCGASRACSHRRGGTPLPSAQCAPPWNVRDREGCRLPRPRTSPRVRQHDRPRASLAVLDPRRAREGPGRPRSPRGCVAGAGHAGDGPASPRAEDPGVCARRGRSRGAAPPRPRAGTASDRP